MHIFHYFHGPHDKDIKIKVCWTVLSLDVKLFHFSTKFEKRKVKAVWPKLSKNIYVFTTYTFREGEEVSEKCRLQFVNLALFYVYSF